MPGEQSTEFNFSPHYNVQDQAPQVIATLTFKPTPSHAKFSSLEHPHRARIPTFRQCRKTDSYLLILAQTKVPLFRLTAESFLHILPHCRTVDLLSFARTCTLLQSIASTEVRRRYFALLRKYFGNRALTFHGLLDAHGAIISGSVALAFFSWTDKWEPGDMDVYVGKSMYAKFIYILERSHFATLTSAFRSRKPSAYHGINAVRRYITCAGQHLDVIQSSTPNPVTPLLYFWSSIVVNFISPAGAVSVFPTATFSHEGYVTDSTLSPKILAARLKYEDRGFTFTEVRSWRPPCVLDRDGHLVVSDRPILVIGLVSISPNSNLDLPITQKGTNWVVAPAYL